MTYVYIWFDLKFDMAIHFWLLYFYTCTCTIHILCMYICTPYSVIWRKIIGICATRPNVQRDYFGIIIGPHKADFFPYVCMYPYVCIINLSRLPQPPCQGGPPSCKSNGPSRVEKSQLWSPPSILCMYVHMYNVQCTWCTPPSSSRPANLLFFIHTEVKTK